MYGAADRRDNQLHFNISSSTAAAGVASINHFDVREKCDFDRDWLKSFRISRIFWRHELTLTRKEINFRHINRLSARRVLFYRGFCYFLVTFSNFFLMYYITQTVILLNYFDIY